MPSFKQRKQMGNKWEQKFEKQYPDATRLSPFSLYDYSTTTSHMEPEEKWKPDYQLPDGRYVEVKKPAWDCFCNWEKEECDFQRQHYDVWVWVMGQLVHHTDCHFSFHKGNPRYSGQDYYKIRKKSSL